nr:MAG TPA: hypothetical protein [Caudoviricetes sp.]
MTHRINVSLSVFCSFPILREKRSSPSSAFFISPVPVRNHSSLTENSRHIAIIIASDGFRSPVS